MGGGQAGLAGEVPARRAGFKGGDDGGALPSEQHIHTNGGLVTPQAQTRGDLRYISLTYTTPSINPKTGFNPASTLLSLYCAQVRKDDVQTVVPISKSWSLMNTAVLTGRQVLFNAIFDFWNLLPFPNLYFNRCRNQ